jgi:hypothetical protein
MTCYALPHVLPRGFVRIRSFGFLANRRRAKLLPLCQQLLQRNPQPHPSTSVVSTAKPAVFRCPKCATTMIVGEKLSPLTLWQLTLTRPHLDSSEPIVDPDFNSRSFRSQRLRVSAYPSQPQSPSPTSEKLLLHRSSSPTEAPTHIARSLSSTPSEAKKLRNTLPNLIGHRVRRQRQRLCPNPPIASASAPKNLLPPECSSPTRLSIGHYDVTPTDSQHVVSGSPPVSFR